MTVVQPRAPVAHVDLLQARQVGAHGGGVSEDKDGLVGVLCERFLEPVNLLLVDKHLVGAVLGVSEADGGHANGDRTAVACRALVCG